VGGNLGFNSAGPRAVKYGTPRENTLGLRAVTGAGEVLRMGVSTTKGVVGYDFTRLLIGSEGTLAVITEATLKLTPRPEAHTGLRALYRDVDSAGAAIARIMAQPVVPSSLEYMDASALDLARRHGDLDLPAAGGGLLMIEVDGPAACLDEAAAAVAAAAGGEGLVRLDRADDPTQVARLWEARKALSPALRSLAPKKINEDVAVPVSRLPALLTGLADLAREHDITIVNFGHAGNGNIHVNLLIDPDDPRQRAAAQDCLEQVFTRVLELGGTLSGEHGVGIEKRDFVARELDPVTLRLMRQVKAQFDPAGILNPDKVFPIEG
jgi:D-lactate dehydrogenase